MKHDEARKTTIEGLEEYLVFARQNENLIELLEDMEFISEREGQQLMEASQSLKRNLELCKRRFAKENKPSHIICEGYKILHILLDYKDIEERIFEVLENKLQFPHEDIKKKLLNYFIYEAGVRILFNTKIRHKLNLFIFTISENNNIKV